MSRELIAFQDALLAQSVAARFKKAATRKPLYGYDSMDKSYLVEDYPYGARLRCKIRYWLEYAPKKGYRFCSQTEDPKRLRWNNPKKSTYTDWGGCMYLDEKEHVVWDGIGQYSQDAKILEFVNDFPKADYTELKRVVVPKLKFLYYRSVGKAKFTINGVPQDVSEHEMGEARKDLDIWKDVAKKLNVRYPDMLDKDVDEAAKE